MNQQQQPPPAESSPDTMPPLTGGAAPRERAVPHAGRLSGRAARLVKVPRRALMKAETTKKRAPRGSSQRVWRCLGVKVKNRAPEREAPAKMWLRPGGDASRRSSGLLMSVIKKEEDAQKTTPSHLFSVSASSQRRVNSLSLPVMRPRPPPPPWSFSLGDGGGARKAPRDFAAVGSAE